MNARVLASRRFTVDDQRRFAEVSGDWNPMHMDGTAARRTQAGDMVVHGIHAMLWGLEVICALEEKAPASIRAQFLKFIYVGHTADLILTRQDVSGIEAELVIDDLMTTRLSISFEPSEAGASGSFADFPHTACSAEPLSPAIEDMDGSHGWLKDISDNRSISRMFPLLSALLGNRRISALARTSTLVGMVCPGLHSIFSSLSATVVDNGGTRPGIGWKASQPDRRYARIYLSVAGSGIAAQAMAFVRPAPVQSPPIALLASKLAADEFAHRRALIIGGSRGLGATTAKLLAAGGAHVALTYSRGKAEAEAVWTDICGLCGSDASVVLHCDIEQPFTPDFLEKLRWATHIYYFATSQIGRQSAATFTHDRYAAFNRIFVERFNDLVLSAFTGRPLNIFYPSTIFVEHRPTGMTEYAMTKAAAEILCSDLARGVPGLSISAPRLPRVLTDQTAAAIPVRTLDAADVMLPLLRQERPA